MVLLAGCLISLIGFGVRSVFGLFLDPMTLDHGWSNETFSLAMAIQNLLWGICVPVAGAIMDRFGPVKVIIFGALAYATGVWGMANAESIAALHWFGGVLTGIGVAFASFSIALVAMAKVVGPEKRSFALGLGTAAGSFGQVVFSPTTQAMINADGWHSSLLILAMVTLIMIPLALVLPNTGASNDTAELDQSISEALREAFAHRGYLLLTTGFFVCGFHVAFITVHFPKYVTDMGLSADVGANSIAIVGLFNVAGALLSGMAGRRWSKHFGLSFIYFVRSIAIMALLFAPPSMLTIYLFAAVMGLLWLSTIPLTSGIVAQVFGVRYMGTLFGIVFLSHQIGSFMGIWLGGWIHDATGSYELMWWAGVGFGLLATLIHLPINEQPLVRKAKMAS